MINGEGKQEQHLWNWLSERTDKTQSIEKHFT